MPPSRGLPVIHKRHGGRPSPRSPVYASPRGEDPEGRMTELVNPSEMVSREKHPGEGNGKPPLTTVAYLGGGHGAMSPPFRATINFFQHVISYIEKIMFFLHANRVQRKVRYSLPQKH